MNSYIYNPAVLVIALAISQPCLGAPIVTASHTFPADGAAHFSAGAGIGTDGGIFDNRKAQTFTANVEGRLNDVSFIATRLPNTTADLRITIFTLTDGQPGSQIASTTLDVDLFAEGFLAGEPDTFTAVAGFGSKNVQLTSKIPYAVVFSTDAVEANYRIYGDRSGYPGGESLRSQNGSPFEPYTLSSDFFFEVTVLPVSEPSSFTLAALTGLLLLIRRNGLTRRYS